MSRTYTLQGESREGTGKGVARALRRELKIPSVIYGGGKAPIKISLADKEINLEYRKGHMFTSVCDLAVGGEKHHVLARDVQVHPVSEKVMHVDFLRVSDKTMIHVQVPVHFINQEASPGLKEMGVLNIVRHEIELVCQAIDIPDHIDVDLAGTAIGDAIKIRDPRVKLPSAARPAVADRDFTIATIAAPRREEVEVVVAPAEGAEGAAAEGAAPAKGGDAAKGKKE